MDNKITARLLLSWGACQERREAFSAQFPGGATPKQALAWATHDDLCWIVECAPEAYKAKASSELFGGSPTHSDLRWIVYYAPEAYKAQAWSALLGDSPTHEDLCWIVACAPKAYAKKAKAALCKE